ncbi:MAG: hypothetical protein QOH88_3453 [Verrucomicrobiota bacterium]|jgi:hypothetical protein
MIFTEGRGIGTFRPVPVTEIPNPEAPTPIEAYYDHAKKCYWVANARSQWIEINDTALRMRLRGNGYAHKRKEGERLSGVEGQVLQIQTEHDVAYAGPLAGYSSGVIDSFGNRILVTSSPQLIEPKSGDWRTIRALFTNLLEDDAINQVDYVWAWLKFACECLRKHAFRPAPILVLAGPRDCGKSLCQNLITVLLGGRAAKPYRYMNGGTQFNGELLGAEHLMIEDETPSTNFKDRSKLGTRIKEFTMNEVQSLHAKGKQAISVRPFWRVTMSLNDDPEELLILPPINESMEDKLSLLKVRRAELPMPSRTLDERTAFWAQLISELPAFSAFLDEWQVPGEMGHNRCGMPAIQHPALLEALAELSAPLRLLRIIDATYFQGEIPISRNTMNEAGVTTSFGRCDPTEAWKGTAEEIEKFLLCTTFQYQVKALLHWHTATGTYLAQLAKTHPHRVRKARSSDSRDWIVSPPEGPLRLGDPEGYNAETNRALCEAEEAGVEVVGQHSGHSSDGVTVNY